MSIEIVHSCDECSKEADHSMCEKCLEDVKETAYDEGYKQGLLDAQPE